MGHHPSGFWPESLLNSAQRYHELTVHIVRALAALFPAEQVVAAPLKITRIMALPRTRSRRGRRLWVREDSAP